MGNKYLDGTALTIAIIGAVHWGLIGLFRFDLVAFLFGDMSWFSRIVYVLIECAGGNQRALSRQLLSPSGRQRSLKFLYGNLYAISPDTFQIIEQTVFLVKDMYDHIAKV